MFHELSAFMVSKNNISRYQEMTQQIVETDAREEESFDDRANQQQRNGQTRIVAREDNMILKGLENKDVPKV